MSDNFFFGDEKMIFLLLKIIFSSPQNELHTRSITLNKTYIDFSNGQKFEPYFWWKWKCIIFFYIKNGKNVWMKKFFARGTQYLSDGWLRKFVLISQFLISGPNYLNMPANFMESNSGTKSPMLTVSRAMMLMTLLRTTLLRPKNVSNIAIVYKF